ncbi:Zinc finger protein Pegasus, partial [Galemys pyrenaicus]
GTRTDGDQNGFAHPSVDVSLDENSGVLDGFERNFEGSSSGMTWLTECVRIHTGEKSHRGHSYPCASAYERHLEAHINSRVGEKPYKWELCASCYMDSNTQELLLDNPLNQPPENQNSKSLDMVPWPSETPFMMQRPSAQTVVSLCQQVIISFPPNKLHSQRSDTPAAGLSSEPRAHMTTPNIGSSQPSTQLGPC